MVTKDSVLQLMEVGRQGELFQIKGQQKDMVHKHITYTHVHMDLWLVYPFSGLTTCDRPFSWAPKSLQTMTVAMKLKDDCSLEEKLWQT